MAPDGTTVGHEARAGAPTVRRPDDGETLTRPPDHGPAGEADRGDRELAPAPRVPRFLGEYEILFEIARGGMGIVYQARQVKLGRVVALKLVRDPNLATYADLRRFQIEAEAVAQLDHPNIVPIYEVGQADDQPYFSMKLIEGGNLSRHTERLKEEPRAAALMMVKLARAIHYAHQRAILHRDLKPSNILVGDHDEPYVSDFGLAKRIDPGASVQTATEAVMGTPAYMPPEQARGGTKSVTTAADIYSLGATLYETLTGHPPFGGGSVADTLRQVMDEDPPRPRSLNPKVDRDLETICLKCLEKEPARRFGSAEAMAEDLERWLGGLPITARPVPLWEKAVKWVKLKPSLAALITMVPLSLLGLIGGGIWFTIQVARKEAEANRGRYAADMNLTRRSVDDGLIYQAREQLKTYLSGPRALGELRSFEWYYLANLCDRTPIRLLGHTKAVVCVSVHPDGNRVVSGGADGTVRLWDLTERRAIRVFEGTGASSVHSVAFSKDGRLMAAGDSGGGLRLWDLETGRERPLAGQQFDIRSVAFSPDSGHLLATEAVGRVVQRDVKTGAIDLEFWQGEKPTPIAGMAPPPGFGGTIAAYTPEGESIVTIGIAQSLMIWDVANRKVRRNFRSFANMGGFSVHPVDGEIAIAEDSPKIEFIDPRGHDEGPPRSVRGSNIRVLYVSFSSDRKRRTIATIGAGPTGLVDADNGQILDLFADRVNPGPFAVAFGPGGHLVAMAGGSEVRVIRLERSLEGTTVASSLGSIRRLAASPDGRLLAVGREGGKIAVWDVIANRLLQILDGHRMGVSDLAFVGPRGASLVSAGGDGLIQIWDPVAGGQPLRTMNKPGTAGGHRGAVHALAVRPDGRQIATGGEDGLVHTWDPATGRSDLVPFEHGASISALAYDPTSTALASGSMDSTVRIWSATSGRRRLGPLTHKYQITSLAFSPNGRLLAGGGGRTDVGGGFRIWDAWSGSSSTEVECPRGVTSLSFSFDSRRVATCGSDAVVQIWDATGGHETLSLDGKGGRVSAVLFVPRALYTAGVDGVIKRWDGDATEAPE
jgi:eukaryotic-like serine/threonine-protein kinase